MAVAHDDTLIEHTLRLLASVSDAVVVCERPEGGDLLPVDVLHTRRGGKDQRRREAYAPSADPSHITFRRDRRSGSGGGGLSSGNRDAAPPATAADASDPTANLTFNLKLSEQEQTARAATALPYHMAQEQKQRALQGATSGDSRAAAGAIYYEPDEFDDFDDEDPDDDLDL